MSVGQGSITFNGPQGGAGGGGITVNGAKNGLSVDTDGNIVLGQDVDEAGNPAIFLSNREIPMDGFFLDQWGGRNIFSDVQGADNGSLFQVQKSAWDSNSLPVLTIDIASFTPGGQGSAVIIGLTDPSPAQATAVNLFAVNVNDFPVFNISELGGTIWQDPVSFERFLNVENGIVTAPITGGNNGLLSISSDLQNSSGTGQWSDVQIDSIIEDTGGSTAYIGYLFAPDMSRDPSVTGLTRGFYANPQGTAFGSGKYIAFENTTGDVYLNSATAGRFGRTGVHGITAPTAWLHLGAGAAPASSSPLKFTSGTNQTTPEQGAMEFNGTNLFFTPSTSPGRQSILMATSAGTAPATTAAFVPPTNVYGSTALLLGVPGNWAAVNIGGTVFKIPLYT